MAGPVGAGLWSVTLRGGYRDWYLPLRIVIWGLLRFGCVHSSMCVCVLRFHNDHIHSVTYALLLWFVPCLDVELVVQGVGPQRHKRLALKHRAMLYDMGL